LSSYGVIKYAKLNFRDKS